MGWLINDSDLFLEAASPRSKRPQIWCLVGLLPGLSVAILPLSLWDSMSSRGGAVKELSGVPFLRHLITSQTRSNHLPKFPAS